MGFTAAEMAWTRADKPVSEILPSVLGRMRLEQRLDESRILSVWPRIIDPMVVAHATPAGFAKGTLFVNVDSNAWLDEIVRYRRHEILERLQHALGKAVVQRISFRVGA
jgi:predicted nucleic acid-binding Zn ribbon protein